MGRKSKMEQNAEEIKKEFDGFKEKEINKYIERNLPGYLTNAIRLALYYGNLRIKYVGFNFTLIAFFASILAFCMSLIVNLNTSLWNTGLPLIIGFFLYLGPFMYFLFRGYKTITFNHSNLQHYNIFMKKKNINDNLKDFLEIVYGDEKNYSIKDDLKALIMQYFYQANYNKRAIRIRWCLISGFIDLVISLTISLVWLGLVLTQV